MIYKLYLYTKTLILHSLSIIKILLRIWENMKVNLYSTMLFFSKKKKKIKKLKN